MSTYSLTLPPLPQSSIHAQVSSNSTPPHCQREIFHPFLPPFIVSFYELGSYYFQVPIVLITFFPLISPFCSVLNCTNLRPHFDSTYLSPTCSTLLIVLFFLICLFVCGFFCYFRMFISQWLPIMSPDSRHQHSYTTQLAVTQWLPSC